jgi:hypothetical protein
MALSSRRIERRVERETSILSHAVRSVGTIHEGSSRQRSRQLGARSRLNATDHRPGVKRGFAHSRILRLSIHINLRIALLCREVLKLVQEEAVCP